MGGRFDDSASRARHLTRSMANWWRHSGEPWLELEHAAAAPLARLGAICRRDGVALVVHARCAMCGVLVGAEHVVAQLVDGRCPTCKSTSRGTAA